MSTRIVLTGPESCGKTELACQLSERLSIPCVPEMARDYLSKKTGSYLPSDLLVIAELQRQKEEETRAISDYIADTDQQALSIWWQEKFGPTPQLICDLYKRQSRGVYLLCYPDLVWEPDPLRENENDRLRLFEIYLEDLRKRELLYRVVKGTGETRLNNAINALEDYRELSLASASSS